MKKLNFFDIYTVTLAWLAVSAIIVAIPFTVWMAIDTYQHCSPFKNWWPN